MTEHKHKTSNKLNSSREQILAFMEQHPEKSVFEVAKIFSISEKTIRTWKAHQSRGTYSGKRPTRPSQGPIIPFAEDEKSETEKGVSRRQKRANELDGKSWLRYSISVWNDIRKSAEEIKLNHPAMFPVQLPKRLIEMYTTKDMKVILDPFYGQWFYFNRSNGIKQTGNRL